MHAPAISIGEQTIGKHPASSKYMDVDLHSTETRSLLEEALKPDASIHRILTATETLLELTERALSGHVESYKQYQSLLLELHLPGNPCTEPNRRWMASQIYQIEDRFVPHLPDFSFLSVAEFRAQVDAVIASRTRVRHPMSLHLFQGNPSGEDVKLFLHHHWIRSYNFYILLAELAFRFENIVDASVFYRNLYGESGAESPDRSHPTLLAQLMQHLNIPLRIDFVALHPLEKAYLNNRIRCVRHVNVTWGLALLYAIESVSRTNHLQIYQLLRRHGVPDGPCEFHRLHGTQDEIDTEELWRLIGKFAVSESFQRTFLQSLDMHFDINRKYFDVLWQEMTHSSTKTAPSRPST